MRRALLVGLVVALAAPARADDVNTTAGQKQRGFAVEASLGSRLFDITGTGSTISFGALQGGVFAGYKIDRVIVGLGFDIARVASSSSQTGGDTSQADTVILFVPGVRVAIVRSRDQRVELFGQFDLGLGTSVHEESPAQTGGPDRTRFNLSYVIGPGLRFWAHPQFAIGALVGIRGDYSYEKDSTTVFGTTTTTSQSTLLTSVFASFQLLGVF